MPGPNSNLPAGSQTPQGRSAAQPSTPASSGRDRATIEIVDRYLNGHNGHGNSQLSTIWTHINRLSGSLEALEKDLAGQKVAGLNNDRTLWEELMQQEAQRTQELNDLRAEFSAALDATKKDLAAEVTNRANDTAALRESVALESGRCTQDFQGLRTQITKDGEAVYTTRLADVKRLRDELVKEGNECKEEVSELRGEIESVVEVVMELVEEKNGGGNNGATSKKRSAASRDSEEVVGDLRTEIANLRAELQQERIVRDKIFKILEDVAEQTFNNHEMIKSLNVRLDIVKDYTLLPMAQGIIHRGAAAEGQENVGTGTLRLRQPRAGTESLEDQAC